MSLAMPCPWKHPTTGAYYLFQRVPADLAKTVKGQTIGLPVEGKTRNVKIGVHVKVSLGTKDPATAKQRFREADDALTLHWQRLRTVPVDLTHRQSLSLAGEVYSTVVARFDEEPGDPAMWGDVIRMCVAATSGTPADDSDGYAGARASLENFLSVAIRTKAQARGILLTENSQERVRHDTLVALANGAADTIRKAHGDYSPSETENKYPEWKQPAEPKGPAGKPRQTITGLFDDWRKARAAEGGAVSSARRWEGPVRSFVAFLKHDDAEAVTPQDLLRWRDAVLGEGTTAISTFGRVHLPAIKAIYSHGVSTFRVKANPALGITIRAPKVAKTRPKGFTSDEAKAILMASNRAMDAPGGTGEVLRRACRWVPWLCAYSGARVGEIAQLRKQDVAKVDGVLCLRITPEAGTVKNKSYRDVPLHPHLIDMGFPEFVAGLPAGPMFYSPKTKSETPWTTTSGRLAAWVRDTAKVTDKRVSPNHGWRHLFRSVAMGAGIEGRYVNDICGHAHSSQGEKYGDAPMSALKREIDRFPRWEV